MRPRHALTIMFGLWLLALTGCTLATYEDGAGRKLVLLDARLSGSAANVSITRPDGTTVTISRDQDSPAEAIEAAANIVRPPWRLTR